MHEVVRRAIDGFGIERCLWGTGYWELESCFQATTRRASLPATASTTASESSSPSSLLSSPARRVSSRVNRSACSLVPSACYPGHHRERHGWPSLADELRLVREGFDWLSAGERELLLGENARKLFGFG